LIPTIATRTPPASPRSLRLWGFSAFSWRRRRHGQTSSSKVRLCGIPNQRFKGLDRLDRLFEKTVRPFRLWRGLILKEGPQLFDRAKSANSDGDQQSNCRKHDKNHNRCDERTARPQEPIRCRRQSILIRGVFIISRWRPLSAAVVAAHFFTFSRNSTRRRRWRSRSRIRSRHRRFLSTLIRFCNLTFLSSIPARPGGGWLPTAWACQADFRPTARSPHVSRDRPGSP
jgi:hypothetical protein